MLCLLGGITFGATMKFIKPTSWILFLFSIILLAAFIDWLSFSFTIPTSLWEFPLFDKIWIILKKVSSIIFFLIFQTKKKCRKSEIFGAILHAAIHMFSWYTLLKHLNNMLPCNYSYVFLCLCNEWNEHETEIFSLDDLETSIRSVFHQRSPWKDVFS